MSRAYRKTSRIRVSRWRFQPDRNIYSKSNNSFRVDARHRSCCEIASSLWVSKVCFCEKGIRMLSSPQQPQWMRPLALPVFLHDLHEDKTHLESFVRWILQGEWRLSIAITANTTTMFSRLTRSHDTGYLDKVMGDALLAFPRDVAHLIKLPYGLYDEVSYLHLYSWLATWRMVNP